ncbi:MAG: alpha/beta fold hydrolase [Synechococcaceae cyanobacterium]|nr:alpha/beta fold hydrolase [Synechococcaceae cyanobacterium]
MTATAPPGPPGTAPAPGDWRLGEQLLNRAAERLLDPQGRALAAQVQWWALPGDEDPDRRWPLAVLGQGPPLLLLHGFDSSFLEYRRLAPLLAEHHQLLIPDLHGFGFTPRPLQRRYDPEALLQHLESVLQAAHDRFGPEPLGLIGASMGSAVAVALARRQPSRIRCLLLLAPAGLSGSPRPLPAPLDRLGTWFLSRPAVRRGLCRSAFAEPDRDVGPAELEIASAHLETPGWDFALRGFARSGGFAGCGLPLPTQPLRALWGAADRILPADQKQQTRALLGERLQELPACGHLPHIDQPRAVAALWHSWMGRPAED